MKRVTYNYVAGVLLKHRAVTLRRLYNARLGSRLTVRAKVTLRRIALRSKPARRAYLFRCIRRGVVTFRLIRVVRNI